MNLRRLLSIPAAFTLLVSLFGHVQSSQAVFQDVPERDKANTAIVFLNTLGIVEGYPDRTFRPDQGVTRAEFTKLLLEGLHIRPALSANKECFDDVQMQWFAPYVCYAKSMGIVRGVTPELFAPEAKVTRAEAAKMTLHAFGLSENMPPVTLSMFDDVQPKDWFAPYMHQARFTNLIMADAHIFPTYVMTRRSSAEILYRAMMMRILKSTAFDEAEATAFLQRELNLTFDEPNKSSTEAGVSEDTSPFGEDAAEQFAIYKRVLAEIQAYHPLGKNISTKDFLYASIEGLAKESGDPYTLFMRPQESQDFTNALNGELVGIGVEVLENELGVLILNVLPNSPALSAGLEPGDLVTHVGEKLLKGLSVQEIVQLMRGEKDTKVILQVLRSTPQGDENSPQTKSSLTFTITRDRILIPSVLSNTSGTKSILKVTQFGGDTAKDLRAALEAMPANTTGIVLDLRNNGGGYLDAAQSIAGFFLPKDSPVFVVELADGSKQRISTNGIQLTELPLMVLVNRYSASAAEVLAGALMDAGRATVVGETTFGKGTMQNLITYTDGSMLRMTIAKWLTPKGVSVGDVDGTHRGLEPQIAAIDDPETEGIDEQVEAALSQLP